MVSLASFGYPGTQYVDQAGANIKGICPATDFFLLSFLFFLFFLPSLPILPQYGTASKWESMLAVCIVNA